MVAPIPTPASSPRPADARDRVVLAQKSPEAFTYRQLTRAFDRPGVPSPEPWVCRLFAPKAKTFVVAGRRYRALLPLADKRRRTSL